MSESTTGAKSAAQGGLLARIVVRRGESFVLDIELDIAPGSTAALLGPNGSGKSTTVDTVAGILPLDDGRIVVDGRVLDHPGERVFVAPEARRVGVVFQRYLLFDHLDVRRNIEFGPLAQGKSRRGARDLARRWIDTFDLAELADRRPAQLSGGQAQRVALARTLASEPAVLLLDEPLAALDVSTRTELRRTLSAHLEDYAGPRLLITHDPTDAFLLADRIHVIENGRITQCGTPDDIRQRPATAYVADLAGVNLLAGVNVAGALSLDEFGVTLQCADTHTVGAVLAVIHPSAVALHNEEPHGSPRNTWRTTVAAVEPLGDITRVVLAGPLPLSADVTPGAVTSLGIVPGVEVWATVKATEIQVNPS